MRWTSKQIEILNVIKAGDATGEPCSVYEIIKGVTYDCQRDAMLHSIRILINAGLVERRGRVNKGTGSNMTFALTDAGKEII